MSEQQANTDQPMVDDSRSLMLDASSKNLNQNDIPPSMMMSSQQPQQPHDPSHQQQAAAAAMAAQFANSQSVASNNVNFINMMNMNLASVNQAIASGQLHPLQAQALFAALPSQMQALAWNPALVASNHPPNNAGSAWIQPQPIAPQPTPKPTLTTSADISTTTQNKAQTHLPPLRPSRHSKSKTSRPHSSQTGASEPSSLPGPSSQIVASYSDEDDSDEDDFDEPKTGTSGTAQKKTPATKAEQTRERNREHARSTRQRKKAYVQKLKDMADNLRAVQSEEMRERRRAVQQLAEVQKIRRAVVHKVLKYYAEYETDLTKWTDVVEDDFWLKQPVTPYRSFRRAQIDKDCRIARGIDAVIADSASLQVMTERIGCLNARWRTIKRRNFIQYQEEMSAPNRNSFPIPSLPSSNQTPGLGQVDSSLSSGESSGGSATGSDDGKQRRDDRSRLHQGRILPPLPNQDILSMKGNIPRSRKRSGVVSSSGEESDSGIKRQRLSQPPRLAKSGGIRHNVVVTGPPPIANIAKSGGIRHNVVVGASAPNIAKSGGIKHNVAASASNNIEANIARSGGIKHSVAPKSDGSLLNASTLSKRIMRETIILGGAPGMPLGPIEIGAYYAMNEDDMIMVEGVMMCPFVLRTKNAVQCGALSDTVMPGMLRAQFSEENKLMSLEMIYDAMGYMQQLDRANGGEVTAQLIPGSLEMALTHEPNEARVITEALPPFNVVYMNEPWVKLFKVNQLEGEGKPLAELIYGPNTDPRLSGRPNKPTHDFAQVGIGRPACSTNLHYDSAGSAFVDFMSSYPLYSADDKVTHILHTHVELPQDPRYVRSF